MRNRRVDAALVGQTADCSYVAPIIFARSFGDCDASRGSTQAQSTRRPLFFSPPVGYSTSGEDFRLRRANASGEAPRGESSTESVRTGVRRPAS